MQIAGSHTFDQTKLVSLESNPTAGRAGRQQRIRQANDSYSKNAASAQVIDAEYVDLYHPEKIHQQAIPSLEQFIAVEATPAEQLFAHPTSSKYPMQDPDTPPPGTYINYFA